MKTFTLFPLLTLLFATTAFAHIKIGTYAGLTEQGSPCQVQTIQKSFENGMHHPLNERVLVQVGTEQFVLSHPAVVSAEKSSVSFNHDVLQAVVAIKNGAKAMILDMDHTPGNDGPRAYHLLENDWASNIASQANCLGLKFTR